MIVRAARIKSTNVVPGCSTEEGAIVDPGKVQPLLQRMNRTGLHRRSSANLNLAPTGFATQKKDRSAVSDLDPSTAIRCIIAVVIEADNFRATQSARIANQQDRTVPEHPKIMGQGGDHRADILCQDRFLLHWWTRVLSLASGQHGRNAAILAVKRKPALRMVPNEAGQTAVYGGDGEGRGPICRCGEIRQVATNHLRRRGKGICALQPAPAREVLPVRSVGLIGVLRRRSLGVGSGCLDQPIEGAGDPGTEEARVKALPDAGSLSLTTDALGASELDFPFISSMAPMSFLFHWWTLSH